jgi:hypothetical protein
VPFLQHGQSDGRNQLTTRTEWLAEGVRGKKSFCPPSGDEMGNRATHFKTMILYAISASLDAGARGCPSRQKLRKWWRNALNPSHLPVTFAGNRAATVQDARAQGETSGVERLHVWLNHDSQMSSAFDE